MIPVDPPEIVRQPPGTRLCGQACLAMLTGRSLEEAVETVGHCRGTKTKELAKALRSLGSSCGDRLVPFGKRGVPEGFRGLGKLRSGSGSWHWVVLWDSYAIDPLVGRPVLLQAWQPVDGRLTSGLEVRGAEGWACPF